MSDDAWWLPLVLLSALLALLLGGTLLHALIVRRGLAKLRSQTERLAGGDLAEELDISSPPSVAEAASAINRLARQHEQRLRTVIEHRNELDAVLGSMVESVIAIDPNERVISLNPAGAKLLGVDPARAQGRSIQELLRNRALSEFVAAALGSASPVQRHMVLPTAVGTAGAGPQGDPAAGEGRHEDPAVAGVNETGERALQALGTVLRDAQGKRIGAVVVLHDVTRLQRLETIQRDFVANVSHELRTPIATIKTALETILDDERASAEDRRRFMEIAARQSRRLESIIEDLLSLSRIEQDAERGRIELSKGPLSPVLSDAREACRVRAQARQITIETSCPPDLQSRFNAQLLGQAVINLMDNAIKFSPPGSAVEARAVVEPREVVIEVQDVGPGIEAMHLPRLFERFYRTDKARSREAGGTGLGLAIVKHIAQAHSGRVSVQSAVGRGSTFRIHLPRV
ncbi:MAG: PAS domain-containing protein [Phycisphaeraceae bacterium]|nr:PAS domain-containing protein [Phycisphaeraceae bacterium]